MSATDSKLGTLLQKKAALEAKIAAEQSKAKKKARTEDTRLKIIVGGAILAHMRLHPETRAGLVEVLQKAVTTQRDRELLTKRGIL